MKGRQRATSQPRRNREAARPPGAATEESQPQPGRDLATASQSRPAAGSTGGRERPRQYQPKARVGANPTGANLVLVCEQYLISLGVYGLGIAVYASADYYVRFLRVEAMLVIVALFAGFGLVAIPYYLTLTARDLLESKPRLFLRVVLRVLLTPLRIAQRRQPLGLPPATSAERTAILFLLVRFFFLPIAVNFTLANWERLDRVWASRPDRLVFEGTTFWPSIFAAVSWLYRSSLAFVFTVEVAIFAAAYAVESRYLRNEARAVSTSLVGWIALLLCYPPLNDAIGELQPWTQVDVSPFLWEPLILLHYTVIVLFALGFLGATLALNLKAAQLSHRGIVTSGPYRLVRHPAYACRIAIWWLVTLAILSVLLVPANVETAGPAALNLTLTAAAWTIVYVIRARAEERLLCEDPTYLAYCQRVRWRFLPGAF